MKFSLDVSVPALTVFFQGLLSFFSPCVLPLIPLYIGYLSGGTGKRGADGKIHYQKSKVMIHTLCFVIGVSFAFFALGLGVSALGSFLNKNQMLFARIGGVIIVLFGFYQLGVFGNSRVLGKERRLPFHLDKLAMSPLTALIMGFTLLCVDTMRGSGAYQCFVNGGVCKHKGYGFYVNRRIHGRICTSISCRWSVHNNAFGIF